MPASRDQLVHVALQVMFQGMQKDALEGIKALATNAKLRDNLLVELGGRAVYETPACRTPPYPVIKDTPKEVVAEAKGNGRKREKQKTPKV